MINTLVLCDDAWHPAEVIESGFAPLDGEEFHFTFVKTAKDILTPEMLTEYDVIICCKGNQISSSNSNVWFEEGVTEVTPREFEDYIRAGGGFISGHSANTSKQGDTYTALVGNYFLGHPPRCTTQVKITTDHPITAGVEDFVIRDEHYQITVTASDAQVLFTTSSEAGGEQIAGYAREIGEGRLAVLTPGHTLSAWLAPGYQKLWANAIRWAAKR